MTFNEFNKRYNQLQRDIFSSNPDDIFSGERVKFTCNLIKLYYGEKALEEYKPLMSEFEGCNIAVNQFLFIGSSCLSREEKNIMRFDCLEHFYWHCYHNELYKDW